MTPTVEGSPPPHARKRFPGEDGTWIVIFGDMCVFAVAVGFYLAG